MVDTGPSRPNQQQLRLALAMRGGVSMAVWIGGAVSEIEHVRNAAARRRETSGEVHPWGELARLAGYDSVEVDVLAGTSAGGLNATLLSASLVYGMPFEGMRRTWVRLADLEAMARPVPKFWHRRPQSLLEGDAYFRPELARAITEHVPAPGRAEALGNRVDLLLTATLLDPVVERHLDGRAEPITKERRRAAFRFRHRGRPGLPLSDFGAEEEFPGTAGRLAQAARTTSSFPLAFEPSEVYSSAAEPAEDVPNMYGLFSRTGTSSGRRSFRVIDGGVLDNIPVTSAIRSIADAPADRPTERWLLYLNPEPAQPETGAQRGTGTGKSGGRRFALPVTTTALQAKLGQESLLADIAALDEHNNAVRRTELRRRALFAELAATAPGRRQRVLAEHVESVLGDHAVVRAELDAAAVHRLLTDPEPTEHGRLLEPVAEDPLAEWSSSARTELREALSARLSRLASDAPEAMFDGVRGLLSGVHECLGWAQDLEHRVPEEQAREIGRCKATLYRLRVFGEVLADHADRYWITGALWEPITRLEELDGWVGRMARRQRRLQHHLPSPIRPLLGAVLQAAEADEELLGEHFQRCLGEFAAEISSIVESSGADASAEPETPENTEGPGDTGEKTRTSPDTGPVDAVAEARAVLHRVLARMAAAVGDRAGSREPQQLAYSMLEGAAPEQQAAVLHRLVVLTAPLDAGGAAGTHIRFLRVAGDTHTPLPFDSLRRGGASRDGRIRVADKVRGSALGNFAAFLSAKWRANDWMWGRLDSAANLVPLLTDPVRLRQYNADLGAEGLGDALQAVVCRPTRAELGELDEAGTRQWRAFLAEKWAARAGDVRAELDALFARPDSDHPLTETRTVLTERLQWAIAAEEVPFVSSVASGADPDAADVAQATEPARLVEQVRHYDVGRGRATDLDEQRKASMATRFVLIAYRALLPNRSGVPTVLARCGTMLLKPLLLTLAFVAAAPTRAALVAFLAAAGSTFTGLGIGAKSSAHSASDLLPDGGGADRMTWTMTWKDGSAPDLADTVINLFGTEMSQVLESAQRLRTEQQRSPQWLTFFDFSGVSFGPGVYVALALAVVTAGWLGWQVAGRVSHGHGFARGVPALFVGGALLAGGYWLLTTGLRLGPLGLAVFAVLVAWLATFAYRSSGRLLATVLTAVVFGSAMWGAAWLGWSVGGWIAVATVVAAYAHMLLLGTVDVLPPRPRPERAHAAGSTRLREGRTAGDDLPPYPAE
ncbi:patatin-like protein [Haloactinomyces albus]|uniref:Patatin-related protein n=1 Tax=Haloactinomyces albus TaxID=1352928 RepID=A0AAE4CP85_9ACTN|nr:patatin-like protein [Haloactinomyces albus]MDR7302847.1 patatin-related protein [Haloactinomyces albus]